MINTNLSRSFQLKSGHPPACINVIEKSCRLFPITYDQKFASHFMLLKRFCHQVYVCRIIFNQQNPSKRICR